MQYQLLCNKDVKQIKKVTKNGKTCSQNKIIAVENDG